MKKILSVIAIFLLLTSAAHAQTPTYHCKYDGKEYKVPTYIFDLNQTNWNLYKQAEIDLAPSKNLSGKEIADYLKEHLNINAPYTNPSFKKLCLQIAGEPDIVLEYKHK